METKIDLKGIVRYTSNLNSPAGSLHELINLRKRYGSWRPILQKLALKTNFAPCTEIFIHNMEDVIFYITYNIDGTITSRTDQGVIVQTLATLDPGHIIKFNSLGYSLIANDLTTFDKYIFRYFPSGESLVDPDPHYTDLSDIPEINMTIEVDTTSELFQFNAERNNAAFQAGWYLLEKDIRDNHYPEYFEGYVFLKWGIELIDGTILKQSMPVFLYSGSVTLTDVSSEPQALIIKAYRSYLKYTLPATLPATWDKYYSLIRGITIFMSKPVTKFDLDQSGIDDDGKFLGLYEKLTSLPDLFKNESLYYRVYHIPYGAVVPAGTDVIGAGKNIVGNQTFTIGFQSIKPYNNYYGLQQDIDKKNKLEYNPSALNINDITAYDVLNVDDVSHHGLIGLRSLNYNGRLFLGDVYTRLFDGFNIDDVLIKTGGDVAEYNLYLEVDIVTEFGIRTVRHATTSTKDSIKISYLLGYPDRRANKIRIIHDSGGLFKMDIWMNAHPILNYAVITYLDFQIMPPYSILTPPFFPLMAKDITDGITIPISYITDVATLATINNNIQDKNRIQLTELFNPYIHPAINSYQVGEGEIIALGVNVQPLEDKFGTFPVFVFMSRGIWTMNLSDTGAIVVNNIVPLSSAVCVNEDSVIVIENLLIFLASDGIKLLTGQQPVEISDIAEQNPLSILAGLDQYEQIKVQALLNDLTGQLSLVDLLEYSKDAVFAYNKKLNELIVSNYSYNYSYIYSFEDKLWYKGTQTFKKFIINYPDTFALARGNDLVNVSEEALTGDIPIYLETKPVLLGPDKEVKLDRITLGGRFDISLNFYGALYVFGSNDGVKWALITGKEIQGTAIYNIIIPRLPLSLRYVILIFSGTMKETSSISEFRILI
jgi:hypothetical protein